LKSSLLVSKLAIRLFLIFSFFPKEISMNPKPNFLRTSSIFILLALTLGAPGGNPVRAAQDMPEEIPPAGLSAADWAQIQALLGAGVPSQQAYMKASNTGAGDWFGVSVAVDGDMVVVGACSEDSNATGVNGNQGDNSAANSGAAYVFTRSGTTWSQQAYLKASNTGAGDWFGYSVAISGDIVVVVALNEDSNATGVNGNQGDNSAANSGAAYVFARSDTTWSQQAYLKASNTEAGDYFGILVSISGDTVVVGTYREDSNATGVNGNQGDNSAANSGAAYVFTRSDTTWSQQAYLKASNTEPNDNFGSTVAISGDTIVVGAWLEDSNATGVDGNQVDNSAADSGAAYVFIRNGTTWSQQAYLKASNAEGGDHFGNSVAISGDTVVVGALDEDSIATGVDGNQGDNSATNSGAAYVFTRSGTTWSRQAYLKASNTEAYDYFGWNVAISRDTVVVGAYRESSNATGVNGNQDDNSAADSGAAYVFTRSGTTWSQQAYLKASNTGAGDLFCNSMAISEEMVVVGAREEDSNATGVNGNQSNNSAPDSSAVYVYAQKYTATLRSVGMYDGHILEAGENSNVGGIRDYTSATFNLGDEVWNKQYRTILSFNTAALPDNAAIARVTLKIKKQGLSGTDPFTILGGLKVDIKKPYFGTGLAMVISDFQAAPGKSAVGTFSATPVSNWYSAVIGSAGYPYINKTGTTQFRLRFSTDDNNDYAADYMMFYSGNYVYPTYRPTLIVEYYVP
jgi:FG-GAP repeat